MASGKTMAEAQDTFDFLRHEQEAVTDYLKVRDFYRDLAFAVRRIMEECLRKRGIKVHSIEARAKDPNSFGKKAAIPSESDPSKPKYSKPLEQITDLAGVRIIAYFPNSLSDIDRMLSDEFTITERSDKGEVLIEEERFGYQSVHYLVRISDRRCSLAEYELFKGVVAEIQVRTILQHAWAEIEHDIQYKSAAVIPTEIHRRFMALAGLLEIADREFQAIQDQDTSLRATARTSVEKGELGGIEITPDALKAYLDKRLGEDRRIAEWQYTFTVQLLKRLGFRSLEQVDESIRNYDGDRLSRIVYGTRQGQIARFEYMLLAAMGDTYIQRHTFSANSWFEQMTRERLSKFHDAKIEIGAYDPLTTQKTDSEMPPGQG